MNREKHTKECEFVSAQLFYEMKKRKDCPIDPAILKCVLLPICNFSIRITFLSIPTTKGFIEFQLNEFESYHILESVEAKKMQN
jgi:hypothetical protein